MSDFKHHVIAMSEERAKKQPLRFALSAMYSQLCIRRGCFARSSLAMTGIFSVLRCAGLFISEEKNDKLNPCAA